MLNNMRILVRDESDGQLYSVGKADATKGGTDVYVYFDGVMASRHGDGNFYAGPVGRGRTVRPYEFRVPSSSVIAAESLCSVSVPSDITLRGHVYRGPKAESGEAFVFSSTALKSPDLAFGAALVDLDLAEQALQRLHDTGKIVSASTYRDSGIGKAVVLWVTHSSST